MSIILHRVYGQPILDEAIKALRQQKPLSILEQGLGLAEGPKLMQMTLSKITLPVIMGVIAHSNYSHQSRWLWRALLTMLLEKTSDMARQT